MVANLEIKINSQINPLHYIIKGGDLFYGMNSYLFVISFFTGILTFFTSCAFILVPPFLGLVSPSSVKSDKDVRFGILKNTFFYILGFSLVFTLLGVFAGMISQILGAQQFVEKIGGVVLIFLGLFTAGFFESRFLSKNISLKITEKLFKKSKWSSFLLGGIFAFGWSPCTGPFLGSILILAGYSGTAIKGAILLLVFSLGIAMPFMFMALFWGQAYKFFGKSEKLLKFMSVFSGIFLIIIGALLATGRFYFVLSIVESVFN